MAYKFAIHSCYGISRELNLATQEQETLRRDLLADVAIMMMKNQDDMMRGSTQLRTPLDLSEVCRLFHEHEGSDESCDEVSMLSTWVGNSEMEYLCDDERPRRSEVYETYSACACRMQNSYTSSNKE